MANWKKMAEAFGRAFQQHGFKGKKAGSTGSEVLDRAQYTAMGDDDLNKAFKQGRKNEAGIEDETYRRFQDNYDGTQTGEDLGRTYDKVLDETSDARLVKDRQKEWDDAFKSAKEHVKRGYGESYPEDMAEEGADTFEKQLWDVIDELKAQGRSVDDILDALKSMGAK